MPHREPALQDLFLNHLRRAHVPVGLFLMKGVRLQGVITAFDNFSLQLRRDGAHQLVYKHAIATIVPNAPLKDWDSAELPKAGGGLQDQFLGALADTSEIELFLMSGVMLSGRIAGFDQFSVLLERSGRLQLVYKHGISTIQTGADILVGDGMASELAS